MAWSGTTLKTGPLSENKYSYSITGLTPNSFYRYRSFFIIDGVEYRGDNIYSGLTKRIIYQIPTILTGEAKNVGDMSVDISGNTITNSGGFDPSLVFEHGLIYTQNPTLGNENELFYQTKKDIVISKHNVCVNTIPFLFDLYIERLIPNTNVFYRAYAKNTFGFGYGEIKTVKTTNNIGIKLINAREIDNYRSSVQISYVGSLGDYNVFNSFLINFNYHLEVSCENSKIPGNTFDNETKLKIFDYNNEEENDEIFEDSVYTAIRNTQYNSFAETIPNPKEGSVTIKSLEDVFINFNYNFDDEDEGVSFRNTNGYIELTSVIGYIGSTEIPIRIVGKNKFSIRANLSGGSSF